MSAIKILVAEWDRASMDKIRDMLSTDEYQIVWAEDGVTALQLVLKEQPDFFFVTLDLPLIDGVKLSQIIRANPKTEAIPIFFMHERTVQLSHFRRSTDSFIIKPFNADEFRRILEKARRQMQASGQFKQEEEFSGNLRQMALPDLIQVLTMNRRSGNLRVIPQGADESDAALITIREGRITNARWRRATRDKAFNRILTAQDGFFRFAPGEPELKDEFHESTDSLLMEGLRQNDEFFEMRRKLPSGNPRLTLSIKPENAPQGLRPRTLEILTALELFPSLSDLLDNVEATDYEVLKIVFGLAEKGLLQISPEDEADAAQRVDFPSDTILEFKKRIAKLYPGVQPPYQVSLALYLESAEILQPLLRSLAVFSFTPERFEVAVLRDGTSDIGLLGSIKLIESLRLNIYCFVGHLPTQPLIHSIFKVSAGMLAIGSGKCFPPVVKLFGKQCAHINPAQLSPMSLRKEMEKLFEQFCREKT